MERDHPPADPCSVGVSEERQEKVGSPSYPVLAGIRSMGAEKTWALVTFCLSNLFIGALYGLLAPFFPNEVKALSIHYPEINM